MPAVEEVNEIAGSLIGAIVANSSLDAATQEQKITEVGHLRATASGQSVDGAAAPDQAEMDAALTELEALARAAEIPSLDKAALALTGVTTLLTGLFVGVGFATSDFVRMVRDFQPFGVWFLILASLAILLGTFAFVLNGYRSQTNLWLERIAVYVGIAAAGTAFVLASIGLAQGASSGAATRPTIAATFDTATPPVLTLSVNSADVPRADHLTMTVWAQTSGGWSVIRHLVTGPALDGTATATATVKTVEGYDQIAASAFLASTDTAISSAPPTGCAVETTTQSSGTASLTNSSCVVLQGFNASTSTTATTASR